MAGCAHKSVVSPTATAHVEAVYECLAEIVSVKREPWTIRISSHIRQDDVWQGALTISLRIVSPIERAGEIRSLGAFDEREIIVDGHILAPGDTISFRASESVLQRFVLPEVFSNLREVHLAAKKANKAPEPTPGSVTGRAGARPAPAPVVAHL